MKPVRGSLLALATLFLVLLAWPWGGSAGLAHEKEDAAANRLKVAKTLQKLGIAMHNYHNDHGSLPLHAIYGADQKPLLSWRVTLLPYLGEEKLFEEFKLGEPWDSEHNKKLLEKMPAIYAPVGAKPKEKFATFYQVFVGPGAIFNGQNWLTLRELVFADGTSNTAMLVDAAEAVPWTKPADVTMEKDKPLPKLGSLPSEGGFYLCHGDCHIAFVNRTIPDRLVRQIVGYNDGGNESLAEYVRSVDSQ